MLTLFPPTVTVVAGNIGSDEVSPEAAMPAMLIADALNSLPLVLGVVAILSRSISSRSKRTANTRVKKKKNVEKLLEENLKENLKEKK